MYYIHKYTYLYYISRNTASYNGGGAVYVNSDNKNIALEKCSFTNNTASYNGGGDDSV